MKRLCKAKKKPENVIKLDEKHQKLWLKLSIAIGAKELR